MNKGGGEKHVVRSERKRPGPRRIRFDPRFGGCCRYRHSCPAWPSNRQDLQQCCQLDLVSSRPHYPEISLKSPVNNRAFLLYMPAIIPLHNKIEKNNLTRLKTDCIAIKEPSR